MHTGSGNIQQRIHRFRSLKDKKARNTKRKKTDKLRTKDNKKQKKKDKKARSASSADRSSGSDSGHKAISKKKQKRSLSRAQKLEEKKERKSAPEKSQSVRVEALVSDLPADSEDEEADKDTSGMPSSISGKGVALHDWLKSLDEGKGSLLRYFAMFEKDFGADLRQIKSLRLRQASSEGVLSKIRPGFWEAYGIKKLRHQLLLAQGIDALYGSSGETDL